MKAFEFVNVHDLRSASQALGRDPDRTKIMAGGVDLLSELKERIIEPDRVINIKKIPGLNTVRADSKGLTLGALVTLDTIAEHPAILRDYTALAEAALSVASPQIRNVGTIGGNLCQRPRCWYYRDETIKCIKKGGSKCYAAENESDNKYNAILGGGPSYIVHPSDCATALVALGAVVRYSDAQGKIQSVPAEEFFILPKENPRWENILRHGEIVTEVFIPALSKNTRSTYIKFKEKDSMDWAVAAVAVRGQVDAAGVFHNPRVVLGGVAPRPWRSPDAEKLLDGKKLTPALASQAADAALMGAKPLAQNAYKVPLTKVLVRRAVTQVATGKKMA
ncbi:MAG: putative xanthine dehydrogenase YagS FAD-binding subunit [Armatimonadetes bacterium]|jgi:xanthine dehydrogenase YagS FAD-binding subunit|nr:putative xanthine dehydrogenase YagS FAD-binding subunit [Armatimonadota bacterium]